jgi:hypothetical protein
MLGQHGSHRMVATFTEVVIHQRHVPEPMRWVAPTYERGIPLFLEHLYGRMFLGWARFGGHGEHSDVLA